MAAILKNFKYSIQLRFDCRYMEKVPNYAKNNFRSDDIIEDFTGCPIPHLTAILDGC